MSKSNWHHSVALMHGKQIVHALSPSCHMIEIVGSVRRMKSECGDVEILCVPRRATDLFGVENGRAETDAALQALVDGGKLSTPTKNGERQKQFNIMPIGLQLDLWLVRADEWPVQLAIRTGPARFSRAIVTERCRGGLLADGFCIDEGKVWKKCEKTGNHHGELMPVETEKDFLERFCGGYVAPWRRHWEYKPPKGLHT